MKERDLKELTLDRMVEIGIIEFYQRDIKEVIDIVELDLSNEQDESDYIKGLLEFGLEKHFNILEEVVSVNLSARNNTRVELKSGNIISIDDALLLKILKRYLKEIDRDAEVLRKYTTKLCKNTELLYIIKDEYRVELKSSYMENIIYLLVYVNY